MELLLSLVSLGTASVALAGLLATQNAINKPITEHRVLFLGAGEVCNDFFSFGYICVYIHKGNIRVKNVLN